MECCGAQRDGNFCSECGRPIRGHGLVSLRNYCAAMLAVNKANYERAKNRGNRIGKMLTTMEKWQRWIAALDSVIDDAQQDGPRHDAGGKGAATMP